MQQKWVNIVKGIAICAVVMLHARYYPLFYNSQHLSQLIGNAWHMPVFFMVAGFFLNTDKMSCPKMFIYHKFTRLYSRLLVFYIPILCLHNWFLQVGLYDGTILYGGKTMAHIDVMTFLRKLVEVFFFMGREPYASPLWFVYVLFMAFIVMSITSAFLRRYFKDTVAIWNMSCWEVALGVILIVLTSISYILTNTYDLMIPRLSNMFPAMWLIYCGYVMKNKWQVSFNNIWITLLSLMLLITLCMCNTDRCMMTNHYSDAIQVTSYGLTALYILAFIGKWLENSFVGSVLAMIGRKSFYVMALHLLMFSLFALLLDKTMGTTFSYCKLGSDLGDNILWYVAFVTVAIAVPTMIGMGLDLLKKTFVRCR